MQWYGVPGNKFSTPLLSHSSILREHGEDGTLRHLKPKQRKQDFAKNLKNKNSA